MLGRMSAHERFPWRTSESVCRGGIRVMVEEILIRVRRVEGDGSKAGRKP
jgi:hypothetical protein